MATYSNQEANFLATELPLAQAQSRRTGIPVSVFLTQSWNETGIGTSDWFLHSNNPAGIGVTGAPGAGHGYPSLAAAFQDYADKLMGHGEAGQEQFAADVRAHRPAPVLLRDLEASPWAAGHYGGTGLEQLWAGKGLGAFDKPGAKAPTGSTPIHTVAYIPGTHQHIPGTGAGSSLLPSPVTDAAGAIFGPLVDFIKSTAVRAVLVIFGLIAILLALALLVKDASGAAKDEEAGASAGRQDRAAQRKEEPAERARPQTQPAPPSSRGVGAAPDTKGSTKGVGADVEETGEGAAALA